MLSHHVSTQLLCPLTAEAASVLVPGYGRVQLSRQTVTPTTAHLRATTPIVPPSPSAYAVEFDDAVMIDGEPVDVKVLYPNDAGEVDVFTLESSLDGGRRITDRIPTPQLERLSYDAEQSYLAHESARLDAEREEYEDLMHRIDSGK